MSGTSHAEPLPVAVCSPQPVVRTGLQTLLARHPDRFRLVAPPDGVGHEEPEVVLYDVLALRAGDAELTRLRRRTTAKVLAVGRDLRPDLVRRALAAGADGCFSLGVDEEELVEAVESVRAGRRQAGRVGPDQRPHVTAAAHLSVREADVLTLITQGLTNHQIADELFLSINSVKTYVRNAYAKIGAANRSQAVAWAVRHGFGPGRGSR